MELFLVPQSGPEFPGDLPSPGTSYRPFVCLEPKKDPLCALQQFGCIEPHFDPPGPQHASLVQASLSFLLCSYTPSQETPEYHRGRKVIRQGYECLALPGESGQTSRNYIRAQLSLEVPAYFPCVLLALHLPPLLCPFSAPPSAPSQEADSAPNKLFTHCPR